MCACLVAQSCLTFCDPMDCKLPSSRVHGILQARILQWVAIRFSRKETQELNPETDSGTESRSSALQADSLQSEPLGKPTL